ncbi:hypothetical protein C8Q76DRAFT_621137, partial [Earliella scabrosa]
SGDCPFIINPARERPDLVVAHLFPGAKNPVLAFRTPTGYPRAICSSVGQVLDCHIVNPGVFGGTRDKLVKQLLLAPLLGENARALAFFGHVFNHRCLGMSTFGVGQSTDRLDGLSFRTMPIPIAPATSNVRKLPGMNVTPSRRSGGAGPSRSFLDMRDKTVWSTSDDIAIWDGRKFFAANKSPAELFRHDFVTNLPRLNHDLQFGDVAIVYYSVSTYPIGSSSSSSASSSANSVAYTNAKAGLSFNLYGAVLVASTDY